MQYVDNYVKDVVKYVECATPFLEYVEYAA